MPDLSLKVSKLEEGRVSVMVLDDNAPNLDGSPHKVWEVEVSSEWASDALRTAIKATADFLTSYLDHKVGD